MFSEALSNLPAIRVQGLSKAYLLYSKPFDRLSQALVPRFGRMLGPLGKGLRTKTYFAEHWVLRDIAFEVGRGETVAIIGGNGAGKSTLLQLICGTLTPTLGEVHVSGRIAALLELGSGFNPEYTGRENVFLNAGIMGLSREETAARLHQILSFADIGSAIDQPVKTYSSGMAMRLAFSVIAHVDASVLVIDEALAVGDAIFQQKCMRWLREFQARGTVLFCSHDMGAVVNLCERAIWLDCGHIRMVGPAKDVTEAYIAFTGAQAMGINPLELASASASGAAVADVSRFDDKAAGWVEVPKGPALGSGAARITHSRLIRDGHEGTAPIFLGGEDLMLEYRIEAYADLEDLLFGVTVADRLGQRFLAASTSTLAPPQSLRLDAGAVYLARLSFRLPHLHSGTYVCTPAVASGTQANHIQHHWAQDALSFDVVSPFDLGALLSLPLSQSEILRVKSSD